MENLSTHQNKTTPEQIRMIKETQQNKLSPIEHVKEILLRTNTEDELKESSKKLLTGEINLDSVLSDKELLFDKKIADLMSLIRKGDISHIVCTKSAYEKLKDIKFEVKVIHDPSMDIAFNDESFMLVPKGSEIKYKL